MPKRSFIYQVEDQDELGMIDEQKIDMPDDFQRLTKLVQDCVTKHEEDLTMSKRMEHTDFNQVLERHVKLLRYMQDELREQIEGDQTLFS